MKHRVLCALALSCGCAASQPSGVSRQPPGPEGVSGFGFQASGPEPAAAASALVPVNAPSATATPIPAPTASTSTADSAPAAPTTSTVTSSSVASDPDNRSLPPSSSPDLDDRARRLLEAVATGRPDVALDFFFPREPFIPLKDVDNPGRYYDELVATYRRDI